MSDGLKVGIVGGRGIGKHHAKWFARAGCEVTAVYGTTPESAAAAAAGLRDLFGFTGRAFHEWDRFRSEGGFDVCSIGSPMEEHLANVRDLAADGKHLLCEKPLVWNWEFDAERLRTDAAALVEAARAAGIILAVNAQYPVLLEGFAALHRAALGRDPEYRRLHFVMETKASPRTTQGPADAWVDLGPHPLAVLDQLAPGGMDWNTLQHVDGPTESVLDFEWDAGDRRLGVHLETRRVPGGAIRRELGNQDLTAEYEGCTIDGDFAARLRGGGQEWTGPDPMRVSVARFVEAVRTGDPTRVVVSGEAALRQQEVLVGVWERCWA
jgi:predicted dehydrogenase